MSAIFSTLIAQRELNFFRDWAVQLIHIAFN